MFRFFRAKTHNLGLILKNKAGLGFFSNINLFFTYSRLLFDYIFLRAFIKKERIFGYIINFMDYHVFLTIFEEIYIHNDYLFHTGKKSPFIIDCGSNMGMAVIYFKKLYPGSVIYAFEPHKETYDLLVKNVLDNKLRDVRVFNKALSAKKGKINFYTDKENPGALGMSTIKEKARLNTKQEVECDKLSSYIEKQVDFLKMDIEGAENTVIEELGKKGKLKKIKQGVIEYHHHLKPKENNIGKMLGLFEKNNFGYQVSTWMKPPFAPGAGQDLLIYFYKSSMV